MKKHVFILACILFSCSAFSFGQDPMLRINLHIYKNGKAIKNSTDYKVSIDENSPFQYWRRSEFIEQEGYFVFGGVMQYGAEPILLKITNGERQMSVLLAPPNYISHNTFGLGHILFNLKIRFKEGSFKITDFSRKEEGPVGPIWENKKLRRRKSRD